MIKITFDRAKTKPGKSKVDQMLHKFLANYKSIKSQFVVPVLILLVIILVVAEAIAFGIKMKDNRVELKTKAETLAKLAALSVTNSLWDYNLDGVKLGGQALFEDREVCLVDIRGNTGKAVYRSDQTRKGYSNVRVSQMINKGQDNVGTIRVELTDYYRANQMKNDLFVFLLKLSIICFFLWLVINLVAEKTVEPIQKITDVVRQMAEGDFTSELAIDSQNEMGEMATELTKTGESLSMLVSKVLDSSGRVSDGSRQIAAGNQDLSQRTQEQAATLQQISATMEEITRLIMETATNSGQADHISQTTLETVRRGELVVEETLEAMKQITGSSNEIAEIIQVVNDIAFQTNLLALNAAVEAARAGEQGRGFAVVAAEVRNLAGRTSESSKEIQKLIKVSVERVGKGNILVEQSSQMLQQIVLNTKNTSEVVGEITNALQKQTTSAEQIQIALDQLNKVTQQNAAMVQELSASGEILESEANNLTKMVSVFKVKKQLLKDDQEKDTPNGKGSSNISLSTKRANYPRRITKFVDDDLGRF